MEDLIKHVIVGLAALACVGLAGYLVLNENNSWGWFLVAAVMLAGAILS